VGLADSGRRQPILEEIGDPLLDHERLDLGKWVDPKVDVCPKEGRVFGLRLQLEMNGRPEPPTCPILGTRVAEVRVART
jgi:hypothetical protein